MAARPVEWVLAVYYGRSAHRATYGRFGKKDTRYTKDYVQFYRTPEFRSMLSSVFPAAAGEESVPITYRSPKGTAAGALVFKSADRPHLKWDTNRAPRAWKMSLTPGEAVAETIPGDPGRPNPDEAEKEFEGLASLGAGQPYLFAVKLRNEPRTLHVRAYLKDPGPKYVFADLAMTPPGIQALAAETSAQRALAWRLFQSDGTAPGTRVEAALAQLGAGSSPQTVIDALDAETGRALADYIAQPGFGLFFDPARNHDAWSQPASLPPPVAASKSDLLKLLDTRFPPVPTSDAAAETTGETDPDEIEDFHKKIEQKTFAVPDATATTKTRGSAQRAFADAVKKNYGFRCAITGITTRGFLVASHIVPWSEDQDIRLDPSNGICLSLLVDRAFEKGHLVIDDDLTIRIDWTRVGGDEALCKLLEPYDGKPLAKPKAAAPQAQYLQRLRKLLASGK